MAFQHDTSFENLPEWNNDERMQFLFMPFKSRSVNAISYDKKMEFWQNAVLSECNYCGLPTVELNAMTERFRRRGIMPKCITTVFRQMISEKKLVRKDEFMSGEGGWLGWTFNTLIKKPVSWSFGWMLGLNSISVEGEFVLVESIKALADAAIEQLMESNQDGSQILEEEEYVKVCATVCPDRESLALVTRQLEREKRILVMNLNDGGRIIKFASSDDEKLKPMSDVEIQIRRLRKVEHQLQCQMQDVNQNIEKCLVEAKACLRARNKTSAKACLRRKKLLERSIQMKEGSLDNIQMLIERLHDADSNKEILAALAAGNHTFKSMQRDGMSLAAVDNVMDSVRETIDDANEMNDSLAAGVNDNTMMAELEDELAHILSDTGGEYQNPLPEFGGMDIGDNLDLPNVPTDRLPGKEPESRLSKLRRDLMAS